MTLPTDARRADGAGTSADDRPSFRIATFGLAYRFRRLLEIIVRHARHNPYRFVLNDDDSRAADCDIALVDMTANGGAEIARTLRTTSAAPAVIGVGRRQHHVRGRDDLLMRSFSLDVLTALNRAASYRSTTEEVEIAPPCLPRVSEELTGLEGVLVVEPSPSARSQLLVALRQIGARAQAVDTLAAAEAVLAARPHDLMVMEPDLPDGDGMELVRRLRLRRSRPAVIIVSRRCGWLDLGRAAFAGCTGYLQKPAEPALLQQTALRALLRAQRRRHGSLVPPDRSVRWLANLAGLVSPLRRRVTARTIR